MNLKILVQREWWSLILSHAVCNCLDMKECTTLPLKDWYLSLVEWASLENVIHTLLRKQVGLVLTVAMQNDRCFESDLHNMKVCNFSVKCICHTGIWWSGGRPIVRGVQWGALYPLQIWLHALGICKTSNTNMQIWNGLHEDNMMKLIHEKKHSCDWQRMWTANNRYAIASHITICCSIHLTHIFMYL